MVRATGPVKEADPSIAAIVLAGGRARRMGGVDKLALAVGGSTVLDRVLAAAGGVCGDVVVVGPPRPVRHPGARFVQERTPGGGPVPAVRAGLEALGPAETVLVVAGDLPLLTAETAARLLTALDAGESDAAAALDGRGRPNPLLAAYRTVFLRRASAGLEAGSPAAWLLPADTTGVDLGGLETLNMNVPADLARARAVVGGGEGTWNAPA